MGQPIQVTPKQVGDVVIFETDRGLTGQDGKGFDSKDAAAEDGTFPGHLAERLFGSDDAIDHVFVASNQVVVRRGGGWTAEAIDAAGNVIGGFFLYYPRAAAS